MSFPITCTACHKTFTISDEIYEKKVAGRVVTIKCKSCGHGIRVDGSKGASAPPSAEPSEAGPAAPTEPLWAVDYPDGQDREFTTQEVVAELERAAINGQTLIWRDGMAEWLELGQVPDFAADLAKVQAKEKAEAAAKEKAEAEARKRAEAEAKAKADADSKAKAKADADSKAKAKADADSRAKAKADADSTTKTAPLLHTPRAPMPTVSGIGATPGAGAKPKSPIATGAAPKAPLGSAPDLKPRAPLGSAPDLKPRAPLGSAPDITPRAPLGASPGFKPRTPLGSAPDLKPRAAPGSAPDITPRMPLESTPTVTPRMPLDSAPETPRIPVVPFTAPTAVALAPPPPPVTAPPPAPVVAPASAFLPSPPEAPVPPLPASVAKVVSKPPHVPSAAPSFPMSTSPAPAFGTLPAVVADHATVEWPEAKKKTPLLVVGVFFVAAAIGGVVFAMRGNDDVPPPPSISAAPPPAAVTTPRATATPSPTTPAGASQSGADTASGSDPIAATPGAGFAELFAAGARKAESKGASVAPATRFDPAVTKAPLAQAATEAQACKQGGGPTGKVTVVVTFEPSGKAAAATITDAPFAGTATGSCISATMKRASIPPFSGLPGTVSKTFSLL